jgi:hypothetical protein
MVGIAQLPQVTEAANYPALEGEKHLVMPGCPPILMRPGVSINVELRPQPLSIRRIIFLVYTLFLQMLKAQNGSKVTAHFSLM